MSGDARVGARLATVHDEDGTAFPTLVLYPSRDTERPERVGPYVLDVAMDGQVDDGAFPLVVVSHGSGGSHLAYRTLGAHLARRGFVVALPAHPRNNRDDDTLAGTHTILADRPRQLRRVIDWAYADATFGPHLLPDAVALVGHSLGAYTALAVAGGHPTAGPHETPDGQPRPVPVVPDPRVKALVLLAPATPWLMAPGALRDVHVPILMRSAGRDPYTPAWHAEVVTRGLPSGTAVDHQVVPDAGHFSFLSPFPPAMTGPSFLPAQDPPGFDRVAYHEVLYAEIEAFLRRVIDGRDS
ncbi:MAG: hypothetical protein JO180_00685 [Gemmatirosa sp.]|nr:hypothetical protein [Gemmatirosa sp.]